MNAVPRYPAKQFAHALGRSESAVRDQLKGVPSSGALTERGREVRTYNIEDLPEADRADLAQRGAKLGFNSISELLESAAGRYEPAVPLAQCHPDEIERAHKLRAALRPFVSKPRNPVQSESERDASGMREYKLTFGYAIKPENWRTLYDRTVTRDGARGQWDRLELYVSDNPKRRVEEAVPGDFLRIRERLEKIKDRAKPNAQEALWFWVDVLDAYDDMTDEGTSPDTGKVKRNLFAFLLQNAPFIGTAKALDHKFSRELNKWQNGGRVPDAIADKRSEHSGRFRAPELTDEDRHKLIARAVELQGAIAQAWRELLEANALGPEIRTYYLANPSSKSYVPARVRDAITLDVQMLLDLKQGPRCAKLNGAYVSRNPDSFAAGDWGQMDDCSVSVLTL